jgi:hypothetical protein
MFFACNESIMIPCYTTLKEDFHKSHKVPALGHMLDPRRILPPARESKHYSTMNLDFQ